MKLFRGIHAYRLREGAFPGLSGVTYDGTHYLMPMFDLASVDPAALPAALGGQECFYPVSAPLLGRIDLGRFHIASNPADSDYVYRAEAFRDYSAPTLGTKSGLMAEFIDGSAPRAIDAWQQEKAMAAVLHGWLKDVGRAQQDTDFQPALEAIHSGNTLGLHGLVAITEAGEPAGFVLASALTPACHVVHFAKGRRRFPGVYPFLFSQLGQKNAEVEWLNFEQDLGKPGLRQNKRSYAPSHMIVKHRLRLR